MLRLAGTTGTGISLAGCFHDAEANVTGKASDGTACINTPAETNGPFPADGSNSVGGATANILANEEIVRQDIRPSLRGMTTMARGPRLDLTIKLVDVKNACAPVPKFGVYVWHCDTDGRYSIYEREDANYLRGVNFTGDDGTTLFTTIFPGCYNGRWPHIHFEVFNGWKDNTTVKDSLLISQFALSADVCKVQYESDAAYSSSQAAFGSLSLASDGIFANNTPEQLAAQTLNITGDSAAGYKAMVTVGLLR
jgi:protocatechuate 3,4-dioxygenase beta subunit